MQITRVPYADVISVFCSTCYTTAVNYSSSPIRKEHSCFTTFQSKCNDDERSPHTEPEATSEVELRDVRSAPPPFRYDVSIQPPVSTLCRKPG